MIRGLLTFLAFISTILFPWPLTLVLAILMSLFEPLVPLAVGIFADTLYYTPQIGVPPLFAICGALVSLFAFFVRSRLRTSPIR